MDNSPAQSVMPVPQHALKLLSEPAIIAERTRILERYCAPFLDGISAVSQALMDNALGELANAAMVAVVADDPNRPVITWFEAPPHSEQGIRLPGTRHGFDGADRVYRHIFVDPANRYELRGKRPKDSASFYFWLEACPSAPPGWGVATRLLDTDTLVVNEDGSFVVTIDHSPAEGRTNHLQLTENVNHISARDTIIDWGREMPTALSIHVITGNLSAPRPSPAEQVERGVSELARHANTVMGYHRRIIQPVASNTLGKPFVRPIEGWDLPWGMVCNGRYALDPDEALVINVNAVSARYFGLQLADMWMVSIDYGGLIASLNNSEIFQNPDRSVSWVIAQQDPGLPNWIETGPLLEGTLLLRWELLDCMPNVDAIVRSVDKVKLADVASHLPATPPEVTPRQRTGQRQARISSIARRFAFLTERGNS